MGLEEMYVEGTDQANIVDGLVLLKNYFTLNAQLNAIQSNPLVLGSLVLEMTLLIHGFLADGEIFKSYGYEDLYENGFLTYDHWKVFQQAQLEKDISALERSYYEIDNDPDFREESSMPLAKADLLGQEDREIQSTNLNISNQPMAEFELVPDLASTSNGPTSSLRPNDKQRLDCLDCPDTYVPSSNQGMDEQLDAKAQLTPQLVAAITAGDEGLVQLLLDQQGAYPNHCNHSPLNIAAAAGYEGIVRLLLDRGADANGSGLRLDTPLFDAVCGSHDGIARLLLDRGAEVNNSLHGWHSPLFLAV